MAEAAPARPRPSALQRVHGALRRVPTWLVYVACLIPAAYYYYLGYTGGIRGDAVAVVERAIGEWALRFLIAGLAITPLRELTGLNLVRFRRVIGLAAFTYVVLHLLTYTVLDRQLDWSVIGRDILKRPYITIGMAAFLLLIPLAVTSTNAMIRRMGPKAWNRLHKLVYVAALFGAIHFLLLVKAWPIEPIIYTAIVVLLIAYRFIPKRRPRRVSSA